VSSVASVSAEDTLLVTWADPILPCSSPKNG